MLEIQKALDNTSISAYNPEEDIHPLMLKEGGEELKKALLFLSNVALESGRFPKACKLDHKLLLQKYMRASYNVCKAYRPITLESIIGKLLQRMMRERLDWHMESLDKWSNTQEAYRKDRVCNDIMIRFVQSVQEGWNRGETTVLCIFDFESYFETLWRDKLICKLYDAGIKGKILRLFADYISNRKFRLVVNNHTTEWHDSSIGTPQGGILSTIATNTYSSDSDMSSVMIHGEYSDDNLKWKTDKCELVALRDIQNRINGFLQWCKENNISYTTDKIKLMVFRPPSAPRPFRCLSLCVGIEQIYEIEFYKILGTLLRNDLSFDLHFEEVVKNAYAAFHIVKLFINESKQNKQDTMVKLYKCLIRTRIDFSIVAITNASTTALKAMETLQRTCLLAATGCVAQTSTEVMNIITNVLPIDLHLKKRSAEHMIRIASKKSVINTHFCSWRSSEQTRYTRPVTTFSKMLMVYSQITRSKFVDPLPVILNTVTNPSFLQSELILEFSRDVETQVRNVVSEIESNRYDIIISTDGSAMRSEEGSVLGKSGCGVVVKQGEQMSRLEVPVCTMSNNYEAELFGILSGLKYLQENHVSSKNILFLCDCIPAFSFSFGCVSVTSQYNSIIREIRSIRDTVAINNVIRCTWVPGHKNIPLNEEADRCAKNAANDAVNRKTPERSVALTWLKECSITKSWQFRYQNTLCDHFIFSLSRKAGKWFPYSQQNYHLVNQLISGQSHLNASRARRLGVSELCDCGEIETREHYLFGCERFARQRSEWLHHINLTLGTDYVSPRCVDVPALFGQSKEVSRETNCQLVKCLLKFIGDSRRFR